MRILQVHTRYRQPGGEDAVVAGERNLLVAGGHEVEVHEFHNPDERGAALAVLARAPWNSSAADAVVAHARRFGADVVHVHNTWFALSPAVFPALSTAGFPTVATIHNYRPACVNAILYRDGSICEDCVGRMPWPGVVHRCYRGSAAQSALVAVTIVTHRKRRTWMRDVDAVVALTRFAGDVLERSGIPKERIIVKPNVVADPGPRPAVPSASHSVLFVGRLTEDKGVLDLLAAWEGTDAGALELVLVGDGPLLETVKAHAGPGVEVLGRQDTEAVAARMRTSRALVLPSRWYEGMPMVLLEAMAAGLPVLVPDHGALPEIAGDAGVVFSSGDRLDLARALESLVDDEEVDRLGAGGRTRYLAEFSPEIGLHRLEEVYQAALGARTGR